MKNYNRIAKEHGQRSRHRHGTGHRQTKNIRVCDLSEDGDLESYYKIERPRVIKEYDRGGPNYKAIYQFLLKSVGNNWDNVWSEISQLNQNVYWSPKDYVKLMVETHCSYKDGKVVDSRGLVISPGYYCDAFYVDPNSNQLKIAKRNKAKAKKAKKKIIDLNDQKYFLYENIWYRVEIQEIETYRGMPIENWKRLPEDVFLTAIGNSNSWSFLRDLYKAYGQSVICTKKEQANSKECKELNRIRNE